MYLDLKQDRFLYRFRCSVSLAVQSVDFLLELCGREHSALLALAGDLGCSGGPTLAGFVSSSVGNNLRMGILAAIVFPVLLLMGIQICKKSQEN